MNWKISIILVYCLLLAACRNEGIVQSDNQSYLRFTGNTTNAIVKIDNGSPFRLKVPDEYGPTIKYKISAGKHEIIVTKKNKLVVHRKILLGKGMTKEINIK